MEIAVSEKLERLKALADKAGAITSYEVERKKNLKRLRTLFKRLQLNEKVAFFDEIFDFTAINLSGISLKAHNLGKITEGKYAQIIAITYTQEGDKRKAKNINLRYFGRVENLDQSDKNAITEFILRWRLEKGFRSVDHYRNLLKTLEG